MAFPKIVWPSAPPVPAAPSLTQQSTGGSLGPGTYYVACTYVTNDGEGLLGAATSIVIAAGTTNQITVTSPSTPSAATQPIQYNTYADTVNPPQKKQAGPTTLGTNVVVTSIAAGAAPPASWGTTLLFNLPVRFVPYDRAKATRDDQYSAAGFKQTTYLYTDHYLAGKMEWIPTADAANWQAFLNSAVQGKPFDFYADASLSALTSYWLEKYEWDLAYKAVGRYDLDVEWRKAIF